MYERQAEKKKYYLYGGKGRVCMEKRREGKERGEEGGREQHADKVISSLGSAID